MVYGTSALFIDWNNDGDYSDTGEDMTARLMGDVAISSGLDHGRALSPAQPGRMTFTLRNADRVLSPENATSPLYGLIKPGRPVMYQQTLAATTYTLFRGFLDDFTLLPNREERSVQVTCLDALARLSDITITTSLHEGVTTGQAIGYVLDAIGWPSGARSLDAGCTVIRHWWAEAEDAWSALTKLLASEGLPAMVYIDYATGNFVYRDRSHRLIDSTVSSVTFRDSGAEPRFSEPLSYDAGWSNILNDVSFEVQERMADGSLAQVWSSDETITLGAAASTVIHVQASDPFKGAVVPVAGTDYLLRSGSVASVTLSQTSGQSAAITITAGAGGAVIQTLALRAYAVPVARTYLISASDSGSITDYGHRSLPSDLLPVWAGKNDAQALADLYVLTRKNRLPIVALDIRGAANTTRLTQCLARGISERVTVTDADLGVNGDFYTDSIAHKITASGRSMITTFGLEAVPAVPASAGFVLGTSVLNTGTLGY
jgi:hypothetical protein